MSDAPERVWAKPGFDSWDAFGHWYADAKGGGHEYVRADLYEELRTKVEVATEALQALMDDREYDFSFRTYSLCYDALRQLKEDKE